MIRKLFLTATLLVASYAAHAATILNEGFDNIATLAGSGWSQTNNSTPGGSTGWFQGNDGVFGSASGASDSYIAANFLNAGFGDISNWLITPTLSLTNNSVLSFATRAAGFLPDRLEVRMSTNGASGNVGATTTSVGDFTTLLATINPALALGGYPEAWTTYTFNISGIASGAAINGRLAFRYNVTDTFENADYIGIDSVSVTVPEPSTFALFGIALFAVVWAMRRRMPVRA